MSRLSWFVGPIHRSRSSVLFVTFMAISVSPVASPLGSNFPCFVFTAGGASYAVFAPRSIWKSRGSSLSVACQEDHHRLARLEIRTSLLVTVTIIFLLLYLRKLCAAQILRQWSPEYFPRCSLHFSSVKVPLTVLFAVLSSTSSLAAIFLPRFSSSV